MRPCDCAVPFRLPGEGALDPAGVSVWQDALARSLRQLNNAELPSRRILDVGGGTGWLSRFVSPAFSYTLIDKSAPHAADVTGVCLTGCAEAMPFEDNSFGLLVSVSAIQYFDKAAFFKEARRVLDAGGVLALHENGCCNPVIAAIRLIRSFAGVWSRRQREYNATILGYLREIPEDFDVIYADASGLLSPIGWLIEYAGAQKMGRLLGGLLVHVDAWALRWDLMHKLAWLRIVHLKRL